MSSDTSFENALTKFRASLTDEQRRDFAPCTLKDVQTAIDEIQSRLGSQRKLKNMKRISKFLEAMTQLGHVVEVFLNVEEAVAFIWGPIKFVLLAASTWVETLELLLDTYTEIGEILPGLTQFGLVLGKYPYLKGHLENYYFDVLDFHINALGVFSRPAWKTVFHSSWKTFKTRFGPLLNNLKRHRQLISDEKLTIAIAEVHDSRRSLEDKLDAMSKQMNDLRLEQEEEQKFKLQEQRSQRLQYILNKFDIADCERDLEHNRRERRYHKSSGDWIFDHHVFQDWADLTILQSSTLYLSGIPGAGKTILTSKVVEHLKQLRSHSSHQGPSFSVSYFYFKQMQPDKRSLDGLLLTLLSQLIHQDDVLLEQTYQHCLTIDQLKVRSSDTIHDLAALALKSQRLCFVVLDGLDECVGDPSADQDEEQKQVIEWFESLAHDQSSCNPQSYLRLFVSGQRNGILDNAFSSHPSIQLETTAAHAQDIEHYAERRCVEIRKKFRTSEEEERSLVSRVTSSAKGMFLYAKIVLSNLLSQASKYDFKQELRLEHFPKGLEEAYERVVVRVLDNSPWKHQAKAILGLVICAERPLMWKEIQSSFCIDVDTATADADRQLVGSCKDVCGSLVEVEYGQTTNLEHDDMIELVHHTAKEFLVESGRLCISRENASMALFCARYLTSLPFTLGLCGSKIKEHAITGYYGFQDYAAAFWWKHVYRMINSAPNIETDLYDRVLRAVAIVMEAYGNSSDSLSGPGEIPINEVKHHLQGLADDAREWENKFQLELRTHSIRKAIEELLSEEGTSEEHSSVLALYGRVEYKCSKPWCQSFYHGFEGRQDRDQHLLEHDRPFRCCIESCDRSEIGFPNENDLNRHTERLHSTQPTIRFALRRHFATSPHHLLSAAARGNINQIEACLSAGVPVDARDKENNTALYLAAENGHIHICRYLLERGADVKSQDGRKDGNTPLHAAARADNAEIINLLLSQPNILLDPFDPDGFTPAAIAAKNGCNNALFAFIAKGLTSWQDRNWSLNRCLDIAIQYKHQTTAKLLIKDSSLNIDFNYDDFRLPLHMAAKNRLVEVVKLLLSTGRADANKVDHRGNLALYYACRMKHFSIIKLLIPVTEDLGRLDDWGALPVSYVIGEGSNAIISLFLESGKPVIGFLGDDLYALLSQYISARDEASMRAAFRNLGGRDINSANRHGKTLLMCAVQMGQKSMVERLISIGADINLAINDQSEMPLTWAIRSGQETMVEFLLGLGANPNIAANGSEMPLTYAVRNRQESMVRLLVRMGANVDIKNHGGDTPLTVATVSGQRDMVEMLIEKGALTGPMDNVGRTPLMWAAIKGYCAIAKLLLEKGVKIDSTDHDGMTALTHATSNNHEDIVKLLRQYE